MQKNVEPMPFIRAMDFLSENFEFARKCRENNIVFIGPDPEVMQQLGDKVMAKEIAKQLQHSTHRKQ